MNSSNTNLTNGVKDLLIQSGYDTNQVYVGATLNHSQLNTKVSDLFLKEFTYSTPENCAKQARIHPKTWYLGLEPH